MSELIWILAIVIALYLLHQILLTKEGFCTFGRDGKNCKNITEASNICKQLAGANCRIPLWMKNDCWINEFEKCKRGPSNNCNCYDEANKKCVSSPAPADMCFKDMHQKCMAGLGLARDPDRGEPYPMY